MRGMVAKEASSIFSSFPPTSVHLHSATKSLSLIKLGVSKSQPAPSPLKFSLYNHPHVPKKSCFQLQSAAESLTTVEEEEEEEEGGGENIEKSGKPNSRRKLFVLNLPWSFSVADIKTMFSECGAVSDVEIIKQKDGKNRGFAFVTMASGEGAQAAIEKFDSHEVVGRIISVQYAKRFKKPIRADPDPVSPPPGETRHKIYVSNLAWKVRSNNLRELFSSNFSPVSARVVFDNPSGRSAGYGFVSFATKEEAESAITELDGKDLLGRPIRLKFSEKSTNVAQGKEESNSDAVESKAELIEEPLEES